MYSIKIIHLVQDRCRKRLMRLKRPLKGAGTLTRVLPVRTVVVCVSRMSESFRVVLPAVSLSLVLPGDCGSAAYRLDRHGIFLSQLYNEVINGEGPHLADLICTMKTD